MTEKQTVIDADAHLRETAQDYMTRLGHLSSQVSGSLFPQDDWDRSIGRMGVDVRDPQTYLRDMDTEGINVAVVFPTLGLRLSLVKQSELSQALARAWNDYVGELGAAHPRIRGIAMVSLSDIQEAVRELRRVVTTHNLVGLMLHCHGHRRDLGHPDFWPIYEEAERLDVPVVFHAAVAGAEGADRWSTFLCAHTAGFVFETMQACLGLLTCGILERCPKLRVGFFEAGCGWVPYWLERIDEIYQKRPEEAPLLKSRPSEYVRTGRVFFTFEPDEEMLPYCLERLGDDCFMFASDYPHWDCSFPNAVRNIMTRTDVDGAQKQKLTRTNALRFYPALG